MILWRRRGGRKRCGLQGGSWCSLNTLCRCAFHGKFDPVYRYLDVGFRVIVKMRESDFYIHRGGSWEGNASGCRSGRRDGEMGADGYDLIGFRVIIRKSKRNER